MTSVTICTATYLRPVGLRRLLEHIAALDVDGVDLRMVLVDNDPDGSAEAVVADVRDSLPFEVTYVVEPQRGITFARNRALAEALDHGRAPEWIAWLDDDEAPRADWLARLLTTQAATSADVVAGPAEPIFADDAPAWLRDSGAFHETRFTTGEEYPFFYTRTSGVILRATAVPSERFDDRLALTGGEDRVFFTRIHRGGGTFVWDDEAVVDEWVPTSRVSTRWLVRRWFRTGVTRSLTLLYLDAPGWPRRLRRVAGGLLMALRGIAETLIALPRGRAAAFIASRRVLLGVGAAYGALGLHFHEYRTIHGS